MCGLVGIFDLREAGVVERELLSRMNETQFHRGPDEGGLHCEPGVGLGHRRLSIIDLSSGQQPLFNEDNSVTVVFNGEIYNFQELAKDLKQRGHQFRTHSDTEVIVHGWEEWGEECVKYFNGMFAFVIWDRNRQTLFLARDRLGVKPLYYAVTSDQRLIFGSELKSLLADTALPRVTDVRAVEDYFAYGYIPEPRTILQHAYKLPPAHTLVVKRGAGLPQPKLYWDVPFDPITIDEKDAQVELIERIREAVRIRLLSEVPIGAFLSGGVDSSAVVAMMAGLSPDPINTCSIAFKDPKFNEAEFAAQVALRYQTNHSVDYVDPNDYSLIDKLAALYDEPYADSSALPTYRVCELARKRVTVALSGDGGDENLAGYHRYRWHLFESQLRSFVPWGVRRPLFRLLGRIYPKADWAPKVFRAKTTFEALARDDVEGYFHVVSVMSDAMRQRLFSDRFQSELQGYNAIEVMRGHARNAPEHPLSRIQYLDMKTYLVGDILTKVDRASMAHALEVREPLLDYKLMEWVSGLPPEYKLKGREGKYIFKKALESYLPTDIMYRPKMGFAVPLANWFRGPLRQRLCDAVLGSNLLDSGMFNRSYLKELLDQHQTGKRDHSASLWALLMYEAYQRRVVGNEPIRA